MRKVGTPQVIELQGTQSDEDGLVDVDQALQLGKRRKRKTKMIKAKV